MIDDSAESVRAAHCRRIHVRRLPVCGRRGIRHFLQRGVFSCYRPVDRETPMPATQRELGDEDWHALLLLAHNNKATAFDRYSTYYLSTSGQFTGRTRTR